MKQHKAFFTGAMGMRLAMLLAAVAVLVTLVVVNEALDSSGAQIQNKEWMKFKTSLTSTCNQHQITPGNLYVTELPVTVYPGFFLRYYDETILNTMTPTVKSKCGSDKCVCLVRNYEEPVDCISLPKVGCNTELRFSYVISEAVKTQIVGLKVWEITPEADAKLFWIIGWKSGDSIYRTVRPEFPAYDEDKFLEIHASGRKMSISNYAKGLASTFASTNIYYVAPHTVYIQFFFGMVPGRGTEGLLAYVPTGGGGSKASTADGTPSWNNWDEIFS